MSLPDAEIESLADDLENEIKQLKDSLYRMCWYMRGGVQFSELLYNIDVADNEIMQRIVKENIENTKNSKMPLL